MKRVNNIYKIIVDIEVIKDMYGKVRVSTKNKKKIEVFEDFYTCK